MIKEGQITKYNGKYGTIKTNTIEVDFKRQDISLDIDLKAGDTVVFRLEKRVPNIYIARNITLKTKDKKMILK